jgi:hypothetical protein
LNSGPQRAIVAPAPRRDDEKLGGGGLWPSENRRGNVALTGFRVRRRQAFRQRDAYRAH